jgi:hypothetical protein
VTVALETFELMAAITTGRFHQNVLRSRQVSAHLRSHMRAYAARCTAVRMLINASALRQRFSSAMPTGADIPSTRRTAFVEKRCSPISGLRISLPHTSELIFTGPLIYECFLATVHV